MKVLPDVNNILRWCKNLEAIITNLDQLKSELTIVSQQVGKEYLSINNSESFSASIDYLSDLITIYQNDTIDLLNQIMTTAICSYSDLQKQNGE